MDVSTETITLRDGYKAANVQVACTGLALLNFSDTTLSALFLTARTPNLSFLKPEAQRALVEAKIMEPDGSIGEDTLHIINHLLSTNNRFLSCQVGASRKILKYNLGLLPSADQELNAL